MSGNKISLSLGGARRAPPPTNGVKRSRAALHEADEEGLMIGKTESVSHFDTKAGGAVDASKKKEDKGPLSIAPQANRDWRDKASSRKRQKSGLPEGRNGSSATLEARMRDVEAKVEASKPKFGLNTYDRKDGEGDEDMGGTSDVPGSPQAQQTGEIGEPSKAKTDDELALDALLGRTSTDKTLIIAGNDKPMTEEDAFNHDVAEAPDMATLDDYARVPVEQFGAALLRGMGWKDGEGIGSQKGKKLAKDTGKLPERRAALLGIGAKENAAITQEIGAWGKASRGKDAKIYNPILIRDKKTGKTYTEEELEKKKQDDERKKYEMEFEKKERDKKRRDDGHYESRDRRKDKRRDDSRDRTRGKDDRDRRRRYDDDSESEEEYSRRKERERRRKRERDEEHDRESSRRHRGRDDSGRDRHHDRDRRDRDRERDRDRRR
ncbi:Putative G-patch domain, pre-mRNA-splicing factor Spp2 [Septoria linicola]|uniref:Pre-mRNA-splicing factor n=1 Tax=Septoria linicola TaxID=215465 RepID=A0A9Q9B5E1_9PEZI|nr:Putative G-patch domain, pre-mRNA-splicing factor Spp2 [Septoria linicola]